MLYLRFNNAIAEANCFSNNFFRYYMLQQVYQRAACLLTIYFPCNFNNILSPGFNNTALLSGNVHGVVVQTRKLMVYLQLQEIMFCSVTASKEIAHRLMDLYDLDIQFLQMQKLSGKMGTKELFYFYVQYNLAFNKFTKSTTIDAS